MRVAVFGLGYVGTVSAACLSSRGAHVTGVDKDPAKVAAVAAARSPVIEPGLSEMIADGVKAGRLQATTDTERAIRDCDISLVCVGTPGAEDGSLSLDQLLRVTAEIGKALRSKGGYHVVTFRSTMLPGTIETALLPKLIEASGLRPGADFGVAMNPEFLREGTSLHDFDHPPRIVVGELDERSGQTVMSLYEGIAAPRVRTSFRLAEMVKYADNAFHALKISFANEIGNVAKRAGIDGREVMDVFCLDDKLNLSKAYLKPGSAFGGSCLPKDLRALAQHGRSLGLALPVINSMLESNSEQKRLAIELIRKAGAKDVGILGLSFKPDTDDLRESPTVELAEILIGKGYKLAIYDRNVAMAKLVGANRAYIEHEIPHVSSLMRPAVGDVVAESQVVVITTRDPQFREAARSFPDDKTLIDLVGVVPREEQPKNYHGICW